MPDPLPAAPLLAPADLATLREALAGFTADAVADLLGPIGRAAHSRGDLAGVARALRAHDGEPLVTLVRLFLLGSDVPAADAAAALSPLPVAAATAAGLVRVDGDRITALLEIRPYEETGGDPWWVVSDFGSDVRPGPLTAEHVLGIGNAALLLAQSTPRRPVGRALDVGTGCGVQALHLGRHARHVTATDISPRALRFAATTAALSGQAWELRAGSLLEPVAGEHYDLIVANPPFVVSPGAAEHEYRDSGMAGDEVCRALVGSLPGRLAPGGTAQLLANWIVPAGGSGWQDRVAGWFPAGSEAWVWQREVADPGEYVALWLRDAGHVPGTTEWATRYDTWLDWFATNGVAAIGMGLITIWQGSAPDAAADVVCEDVPQPVEQPVGAEIAAWIGRHRWLRSTDPLRATYRPAPDLTRTRADLLGEDGWTTRRETLRLAHGMRWELEVDDAVARLVAACAAGATPLTALEVLAAMAGEDGVDGVRELADRFRPVLVDLVRRGVLLPETTGNPA